MALRFSSLEDEALIDKVQEFRCLYDHEHADFKDNQIRENVWAEISEVVLRSSEDCKIGWKNIRDNYLKLNRKQKQGTGSAASTRPPKWPLFEYLKFLDLTKSERSRINNNNENSDDMTSYSTQQSEDTQSEPVDDDLESQNNFEGYITSPEASDSILHKSKKLKPTIALSRSNTASSSVKSKLLHSFEERSKKRLELISQLSHRKDEDEVDLFMRSMAMMIKKLPPDLIPEAKLQLLTVITNLEVQANSYTLEADSNELEYMNT